MGLKVETIVRKFTYNGVNLPDPNPALPINEVQGIFAHSHPEIANAAIDGPAVKGNVHTYTFVRSVGTKG
jgi:PRTRC genetic system protein C